MGYNMVFYVDGGCRHNGSGYAIGAAAAVKMKRNRGHVYWTEKMDFDDSPTNQRAEMLAIILALPSALSEYDTLNPLPYLFLEIRSDSKYAIGCMTEWKARWICNGWRNSRGNDVANTDLIRQAYDLEDRVKDIGKVTYTHIPRAQNTVADGYCNQAMDEME
ncbi:ribonuclease H-like domain-containing [Lecanosticta acicola]|uniref:ribonuclease H n=1 Tax=Lecanosticta acicola TaxID=111012 RepID=A0AAI9EF72_9PEZI|nr:ribonuclease H-like domain-containing [Lecanosticta acicola]